jgi:general secretion pathway protein G
MKLVRGFTLIELVVALALVGVMAWLVVPMYEVTMTRAREAELRTSLRQIRAAIDAYKAAADSGTIAKRSSDSGYPASLEVLVRGVAQQHDAKGRRLIFLRQVPRDPFASDPTAPPERQWATRAYESTVDDSREGDDVFDVTSRSPRAGLNGVPYRQW